MSSKKLQARPTVDVNPNGIQSPFDFWYVETPAKKVFKSLKKKKGKARKFLQLKFPF